MKDLREHLIAYHQFLDYEQLDSKEEILANVDLYLETLKEIEMKTPEEIKELKRIYNKYIIDLFAIHLSKEDASKLIPEETDQFIKDIVDALLPSDEEIEKMKNDYKICKGFDSRFDFSVHYNKGMNDLKQQILNKLK